MGYLLDTCAVSDFVKGEENTLKRLKSTSPTDIVISSLVKSAESYFTHIRWLQERFPGAVYEDVTGLCKLATLEEVKEQDYSLNPGRFVGVVIEEDGWCKLRQPNGLMKTGISQLAT